VYGCIVSGRRRELGKEFRSRQSVQGDEHTGSAVSSGLLYASVTADR
jgi:hypothetical protein